MPVALKLDQCELSKSPMQLAQDILSLCQLSAKRMQVARRRSLVARGFSPVVIRGLNLCTEEELTRAEAALLGEQDPDGPPNTWLNPI